MKKEMFGVLVIVSVFLIALFPSVMAEELTITLKIDEQKTFTLGEAEHTLLFQGFIVSQDGTWSAVFTLDGREEQNLLERTFRCKAASWKPGACK